MPRDERRRQKSLARKAARHKQKKKSAVLPSGSATGISLRAAAEWPLLECLLSRSWREPGELVQILVARSSGSAIAAAGILVDLGCLGVKDALHHLFVSSREYQQLRGTFAALQPMDPADLDLAAKIIDEGIAYAARLGFSPHPDYRTASVLLAGANPAACDTAVPLGDHGQPLYIPGPHDRPDKIIRQLKRAVGPGNFQYILELGDVLYVNELEGEADEPEPRSSRFLPGLFRGRRS